MLKTAIDDNPKTGRSTKVKNCGASKMAADKIAAAHRRLIATLFLLHIFIINSIYCWKYTQYNLTAILLIVQAK